MKTSALALLLLAAASGLNAQSRVPYIETFEVRLHNLDVVVTDAKGQPVHGLTENDFAVFENGTNQPITNFSAYDANAATATLGSSSRDAVEAATQPPPPRHYIFYVDDLQMRRALRDQLHARLQEFVNTMREGDVAAVVRPTAAEKVVQEFTSDRAAIERTLKDVIDDSKMKYAGPTLEIAQFQMALHRGDNLAMAQREYAYATRRRVEHRLGQLRALTSSLAGIEGRKILIMVTEALGAEPGSEARSMEQALGFPAEGGLEPIEDGSDDYKRQQHNDSITRNYERTIADIARSAAANGVTIYALEPNVHLDLMVRGAAAVPVKKGPSSGGGHFGADAARALPTNMHSDLMQNSATTLASLSEKTGGKWFRGTSGIDETFAQVATDLSAYYSLAYRATGAENGPRRVQVKVRNRPDLHVRTRSEVLQKSTGREMDDLVVASLLYPRPVNELAINVTAGAPVKNRGYYTIPLDVVVPMRKLTFLPTNDGAKYVASFDVHFALAGVDRDFLQGGKTEQIIEITPEQYEQLDSVNYRYKTGINVSKGSSKIAIGLIDDATKLTGFGTVDVVTR
ncbi:MAG TPA: VWA domain-containing protein [Thermoanaerobaculia bacterium]